MGLDVNIIAIKKFAPRGVFLNFEFDKSNQLIKPQDLLYLFSNINEVYCIVGYPIKCVYN